MHWRGKANAPYEFGVKVSIVTTNARARVVSSSCQRRRRAIFTTAHPRDVIDQTEKLAGKIEWGYVDKGPRHEGTENPRRVFISRQQSGMLGIIKTNCDVALRSSQ